MRAELERTYPVALKQAWDYLDDFRNWPAFYAGVLEIIDPDQAAWDKPGDKVRFAYKMLGRRIESEATKEEVREGEYAKFSTTSVVGDVHHEWFCDPAGGDAFTLKVMIEIAEPTSLFGKVIDRTVVPRVVKRDLEHTLDSLAETFALGVPE